MNETKNLLHTFLRERIHDYRINQKFSIETMAEALQISPRSYIDQEHGKYGFSALSMAYFMILLSDEEVLKFSKELRVLLGRKEDAA